MFRHSKPIPLGWIRTAVLLSVAGCLAASRAAAQGDPPDPKTEARRNRLALHGGGATFVLARTLGVNTVMGKPIPKPVDVPGPEIKASAARVLTHEYPQTDQPPKSPNNTAIRYFPNVSENEPTVVVDPKDSKRVVAGTHFIGDTGNRCVAHYSRDGGKTWNPIPIFMRQLTHESDCSDPVLAYAPDGSRVYYAYMDIKSTHFDIVVSYSDDDGRSWKGPFVALANPAADYDKPWIGTHVSVGGSHGNRNWVYVTATRFDFADGQCHIDFTRSSNKGITWSAPPTTLETGACNQADAANAIVVQGSRPTGGLNRDVLVAWYHSGTDGWGPGIPGGGTSFNIRTRYSSNNGATFGPIVQAAATESFELPFWLGPNANYHRWWGGMFPDVEIAPNGSGHIAYTYDPVAGSVTAEDGDIRYTGSAGPPYSAWTAPTTANDDASGKAQGWATLEADSSRNQAHLYAIWEDHRTSASDNEFYDVFWAKRVGSGPWSNDKLTDEQSTSDFIFLGDYYDLTIADGGGDDDDDDGPFVYGVWTDRRDEPSIFDFDDDIWGARIPPGSGNDGDD